MAKRNILLRESDVEWIEDRQRDGRLAIVVRGRGRSLRLPPSPRAVFFQGRREHVKFTRFANIISADEREPDDKAPVDDERPAWMRTLYLGNLIKFPADATLANFAFSLPMISNVGEPWRHIRHRGVISDIEVDILALARVHAARTTYFGILIELPREWRQLLDDLSKARQRLERTFTHDMPTGARDGTAVPQLRQLLERLVLTPGLLAKDIAGLHGHLFPDDGPPELVGAEQTSGTIWDLEDLFNLPLADLKNAHGLLAKVVALAEADQEPLFEEVEWRQYRL